MIINIEEPRDFTLLELKRVNIVGMKISIEESVSVSLYQ